MSDSETSELNQKALTQACESIISTLGFNPKVRLNQKQIDKIQLLYEQFKSYKLRQSMPTEDSVGQHSKEDNYIGQAQKLMARDTSNHRKTLTQIDVANNTELNSLLQEQRQRTAGTMDRSRATRTASSRR